MAYATATDNIVIHLLQQAVIHRDLKPENILMG